jgi:hypothetical protein
MGHSLPTLDFLTRFLWGGATTPTPNPNLEDQVLVFVTPGNRMTQLYPQALGPLLQYASVTLDYTYPPVTTQRELNRYHVPFLLFNSHHCSYIIFSILRFVMQKYIFHPNWPSSRSFLTVYPIHCAVCHANICMNQE